MGRTLSSQQAESVWSSREASGSVEGRKKIEKGTINNADD